MKRFKLINNIFGWLAFAVAAFTYLTTIEPTGSFWDCGEFISTAFKLDVGHPPGAPFFMLMGRFFALFASDTTQVAAMINSLSALASAFTILFLFWTITHLAAKVLVKDNRYTLSNTIAIIGAGLVGALAYTFSDTFWFSAVEGEVYATSSLFTAVVFWLILKWESVADKAHSDRWLILIAYLMGLSIGIHLLNLLTIPAIVLVYYFKRYNPSLKGALLAMAASAGILIFILYGLVPGFVEVSSWFELLFVNSLNMPFNTGLMVYIVLAVGVLVWAIYETYQQKTYWRTVIAFLVAITLIGVPFLAGKIWVGVLVIIAAATFFYYKKQKVDLHWLNTIVVMATVMLIGYSSYGVIVIRSAANPPMDQNSPDNVFALKGYLNREQYGDRPLFYGASFNAPMKYEPVGNGMYRVKTTEGAATYAPKPKTSPTEKDEYIVVGHKVIYEYEDAFKMLFPRMYSSSKEHIDPYKVWSNFKGKTVKYELAGQTRSEIAPTFGENLRFFFDYQLNFMYFRYFMWNFAGRQNDIQTHGEVLHGQWVTGIKFIDNWLVGDNEFYPSDLANNKGHNKYFLLPLILGLIGIFFQLYSGKRGMQTFWVTMLLFFLTGIAIVLYLNQTPIQPRERDYAYAGSFYAFCIWIGIGVLGIVKLLSKIKMPKTVAAAIATVACLGVPVLMAQQNWDDHDRSGRTAARDFGSNYLLSCQPNAIIFTNGDNDTFPLWYNQEVEGVRTDVRVCNLSYLHTDWYIDQMKRGAYESEPLPILWEEKDYITGKADVVRVDNVLQGKPLDLESAFEFLKSEDASTKKDGDDYIPTTNLYLPVNAEEVVANGAVSEDKKSEIVPQINFTFGRMATKSELMVMEILKTNNWKRPVYFATTVGDSYYLNMRKNGHFVLTGMAYQVLPINTGKIDNVAVEECYDNIMNKFRYGNLNNPKVYADETVRRMVTSNRLIFSQLTQVLIDKNDTVRAKQVIDKCFEVFPLQILGSDGYLTFMLIQHYYKLGDMQKANELMEYFLGKNNEYLLWGFSLKRNMRSSIMSDLNNNMVLLGEALRSFQTYGQEDLFNKYMSVYQEYSKFFQ